MPSALLGQFRSLLNGGDEIDQGWLQKGDGGGHWDRI
jgi:hypothetical protein